MARRAVLPILGKVLRLPVSDGEAIQIDERVKLLIRHAKAGVQPPIPVGIGDDGQPAQPPRPWLPVAAKEPELLKALQRRGWVD